MAEPGRVDFDEELVISDFGNVLFGEDICFTVLDTQWAFRQPWLSAVTGFSWSTHLRQQRCLHTLGNIEFCHISSFVIVKAAFSGSERLTDIGQCFLGNVNKPGQRW